MKRSKFITKYIVYFIIINGLLCIVVGGFGYFTNKALPPAPQPGTPLSAMDKIRLEEALHLKDELGETVWPDWGMMQTPILLWDSQNNYLIGYREPPPGWNEVAGDDFLGKPYYKNPGIDPENFAMEIGGKWVAAMATKGEADYHLRGVFQDVIPDILEAFVPFRLLILDSEFQISGVLHETFHVYQAKNAPENFSRALDGYRLGEAYWRIDSNMHKAWGEEMDSLIKAVEADSRTETAAQTREFINQRVNRRVSNNLSDDLISFETQIEWLEGLPKYIELSIWEIASGTNLYTPIPGLENDRDFKSYETFKRRWSQEINQAGRQAEIGSDVRFYYSGMLQARILDKLMPVWKTRIMDDGVFLEDLILEAISN